MYRYYYSRSYRYYVYCSDYFPIAYLTYFFDLRVYFSISPQTSVLDDSIYQTLTLKDLRDTTRDSHIRSHIPNPPPFRRL